MAANLPFKLGDTVYNQQNQQGIVSDFKPLNVNDPSNGQFLYQVKWHSGESKWHKATEIYKKSFLQKLLQKFTG